MKRKLTASLLSTFAALSFAQMELPQQNDAYYSDGQATLERMMAMTPNTNQAKNVILFVSDGAGPAIVTATRIFHGQLQGMMGEENILPFETFPYVALTKTYNDNAQTPDSAGTSTAMNSGVKTKQGVLGIAKEALRGSCEDALANPVMSLAEMAESAGMATGVVSTARITHATPAAVYAHSADRNWEDNDDLPEGAAELGCVDIAAQLIDFSYGDGIDIALGGGRRHFLGAEQADPEDADATGNRTDGRDLTAEWTAKGGSFIFDQAGFDAIDPATTGPVLGLFERSHMEYEHDRPTDTAGEPSLAEMTLKAIQVLKNKGGEQGFFLSVEGGRVDHAAHAGNAHRMLTDNVAFAEAVVAALENVNLEETLIIVTADHAHTVTLAGYAKRGNPILGLVEGLTSEGLPSGELLLAADEKPYTSIGFANGPGAATIIGQTERPTLTQEEVLDPEFLQQALIPMSSETHGGTDIVTYATGPQAHLMGGVIEQSYLFHVMQHALNLQERSGMALAE